MEFAYRLNGLNYRNGVTRRNLTLSALRPALLDDIDATLRLEGKAVDSPLKSLLADHLLGEAFAQLATREAWPDERDPLAVDAPTFALWVE